MKRLIIPIICILSILTCLININKITDKIINILNPTKTITITYNKNYSKPNYDYISNTKEFIPYGKQDILNIFYTVLNNGVSSFTFYCPKEYTNCLEDVEKISKDENLLTHLNNFVHPYNSFESINTKMIDTGEVNLKITYIYSKEFIDKIETEVNKLLDTLITDNTKSAYDKIKIIHDYIINNTRYDVNNNKDLNSYNAYGTLFNHIATCNGYTDLMAIFLTKMGYENFKIATTNDENSGHVWNAVKLNNEWLHLDLTWDDPVSSDNKDYLYHKYFLINSEKLKTADSNITSKEHVFDYSIYSEFKTN